MTFLVVLGMHRTGTSALAGVLHALGLHAGDELQAANEFNPKGYFEDGRVVARNDTLLDAFGRSWRDERPLPDGWPASAAARKGTEALVALLRDEYQPGRPRVLKDPRLCRLLPLWLDALAETGIEPGFIVNVRAPQEAVASLMHRNGFAPNKAALLYAAYLLDAERYTRAHRRVVVDYASLLRDWRSVRRQIESALAVDLPANEENAHRIDTFLGRELNHHAARAAPPDGAPMRLAQALYDALAGPLDATAWPAFDALRGEMDRLLQSLEPWLSDAAEADRLARQWAREVLQPGARLESVADRDAQSVLYWKETGTAAYAEARSVGCPWRFGVGPQLLRFTIPEGAGAMDGLRWDITDRPAFCRLFEAWIEDPQGTRVWQWRPGTPLLGQPMQDMRLAGSGDGLGVVLSGFDPFATPLVPDAVLAGMSGGWVFAAVMAADLPVKALPRLLDAIGGA